MLAKHTIVTLVILLLPLGTVAQQPASPPDCQTQLGMAHNRAGQYQTLAREDREALILYFQKIVQDGQAELRKVVQERDELQRQVNESKKVKEPG